MSAHCTVCFIQKEIIRGLDHGQGCWGLHEDRGLCTLEMRWKHQIWLDVLVSVQCTLYIHYTACFSKKEILRGLDHGQGCWGLHEDRGLCPLSHSISWHRSTLFQPCFPCASIHTLVRVFNQTKQDHLRIIDSTGLNNHLRSIGRF